MRVVIARLTSVLASMAFICSSSALLAQSASQSCTAISKDVTRVPIVIPSPDYYSANDPDLEYRKVVRRSVNGTRVYANSMVSDFVSIRGTLSRFQDQLEKSQKAFWGHYDRTGKVDPRLKDELGYWLHKREVFEGIKTSVRMGVSGAGQGMGGVMDLVMGSNSSRGFNVPPKLATLPDFDRMAPLSKLLKRDDYKENLKGLSTHGFLTYSNCAPKHWGTSKGRVLHGLMYPGISGDWALQQLAKIDAANQKRGETFADTEEYVARMQSSGSRDNYYQIAINSINASLLQAESKIADDLLRILKNSLFLGFRNKHEGGNYWDESTYLSAQTVNIPSRQAIRRYRRILYKSSSIPAEMPRTRTDHVKACWPERLKTLNRRLVNRNGDSYTTVIQEVSMAATSAQHFVKSAAIFSCALDDGLKNPSIRAAAQSFGWEY